MEEKLIQAIIDGLKGSGRTDLVKLFEIKEDSEVEDIIKGLTNPEPKTFVELLQSDKGYQSEFDKLVTKAIIKREENLKKKYNFVKRDSFIDDDDDDDDDGKKGKKKSKTMSKEEKLEHEIEQIKKLVTDRFAEQTLEEKKKTAKEMLKNAKIPERYVQFFDFNNKEVGLEEQFKGINEDFQEFKKSIIDETVGSTGFPMPKNLGDKVSDKEVDDIIENL